MGLYQAWGVKSGSGVCAGCGAQWLGRGWVATGSTIGVAWVNGHHPDFLSTWICQLKQLSDTTTDLTGNKKNRTKILFEDVRHYLKYAEYPDSYFRQSGKKTSLRKNCHHFRYDTEGGAHLKSLLVPKNASLQIHNYLH